MKRLLSLFILLTGAFSAYCQFDEIESTIVPNSVIGVRGGLNFSKIDADLGGNTTARRGIHAGIFYQQFFSDKFSIQPELHYSGEGWDADGVDYQIKYLALAVVGKFYLIRGLNFNGGLQPAYQLSTSYDNTSSTVAIDDRITKTNLSVIFGLGYDFGFGLRFGGRYLQGLIDINDGLQVNTKDNEIKTRSIQIYIGYGFSLPTGSNR